MPSQKRYKVVRDFTDAQGKQWKAGEQYQPTNEQQTQTNVQQGNVQEDTSSQ